MSTIKDAAFPVATGGALRSLADRSTDRGLHCKDYGAVNDGSSHPLSDYFGSLLAAQVVYPLATSLDQEIDEVAIQKTISLAYNNRIGLVLLGFGDIQTTGPIYHDADSNLSVDVANPTKFSFSLEVAGVGPVNGDGWGTRITPASNDYVVWWLGPGQGNKLYGVNIMGPSQISRASLPTTGAGIAIAGGPGGASRTTVERCWVQYLYTGFSTGFNSDSLADSNMFIDCNAVSCYFAYKFCQSQNYINTMVHCNAGNCKYSIWSAMGKAVNVFGGNLSAPNLLSNKFTISSVSALTVVDHLNMTFTATIASPDVYMGYGDYDAFGIKTDNFGLVQLSKTAYNSGTGVVTLKIDPGWIDAEFGYQNDISSITEIGADIQACTTLYCAERALTLVGTGIHIYGTHLENPTTVTTFLTSGTGFNGDTSCTIDNLYCNYSPGGNQFKDSATQDQIYFLQQCWPFIEVQHVPVIFRSSNFYDPSEGFIIRVPNNLDVRMEDAGALGSPKFQVTGNINDFTNTDQSFQARGRGLGKWDRNPFFASAEIGAGGQNGINKTWKTNGLGQSEYWGFFPRPGNHPILTPAQVVELDTTPGTLGQYPAITGGIAYRVMDHDTPVDGTGKLFAMSDHKGVSYGQDLAINYTYKGQSNCIYMDDVSRMFPGLVISPDGTDWYVVRGVFKDHLNYVTVTKWSNDQNPQLVGTKTTIYTGSTIYQQDYNVVRF